jgi:hypothetical protein
MSLHLDRLSKKLKQIDLRTDAPEIQEGWKVYKAAPLPTLPGTDLEQTGRRSPVGDLAASNTATAPPRVDL